MMARVRVCSQLMICMSDYQSYYASIDRAYHQDKEASGTSAEDIRPNFLVAEDVMALLKEIGIPFVATDISTTSEFETKESPARQSAWEFFNQWCVYDSGFEVTNDRAGDCARNLSMLETERGFKLLLTSKAITVQRDVSDVAPAGVQPAWIGTAAIDWRRVYSYMQGY